MECDACREFHREDHEEAPPCETDPEYTCPRELMDNNPLSSGNQLAVLMYGKVASQFCYDFRLSEFRLESYGYYRGLRETNELLDLLAVIHSVRQEKKEKTTKAGNGPANVIPDYDGE